ATLPYEEWVQHGSDAWIAALGVPAAAAKSSKSLVPKKDKVVIARAGAIAFTSSATQRRPSVTKDVAPWSAEQAYRHTLVMGNDGEVLNRIVTHENAASCVHDLACDSVHSALKNAR